MSTRRVTFANKKAAEFATEIKRDVAAYFTDKGISSHANAPMILKTVIMLALMAVPYALILSGAFGLWTMLGFTVVMGIGIAGVGFNVGHDALHGAYSSKSWINRVLGSTFDIVGANSYLWKLTHNKIHHTYTNVPGLDEDIVVSPAIRMCPTEPRQWFHRFQQFFAWPFYSMATIFWLFVKDYKYILAKRLGPFTDIKHPRRELVALVVWKIVAMAWMIVIPLLVLNITWWQFLIGFVAMHVTAGFILGIVFQMAHVVEEAEFPQPDESGRIDDAWVVHQLRTSTNFGRHSPVVTWYVGGLNFQIEHHLFPKVCSIHYPAISDIVKTAAERHGLPYFDHGSFARAIRSHYRTLAKFGRPEPA